MFANHSGCHWWFTRVYGPQADPQKLLFLNELRELRTQCPGPWLITGDFNLIYRAEDNNNTNVDRAMMGRFRQLLNDLELKEIKLLGHRFTWSNERSELTLVRVDRAFCTVDWDTIYPDYVLHSTAVGVSNHCLLILNLRGNSKGKWRFHFESFWPKVDGFQEAVQSAWMAAGHVSCPLQRLADKFRATSRATWSKINWQCPAPTRPRNRTPSSPRDRPRPQKPHRARSLAETLPQATYSCTVVI